MELTALCLTLNCHILLTSVTLPYLKSGAWRNYLHCAWLLYSPFWALHPFPSVAPSLQGGLSFPIFIQKYKSTGVCLLNSCLLLLPWAWTWSRSSLSWIWSVNYRAWVLAFWNLACFLAGVSHQHLPRWAAASITPSLSSWSCYHAAILVKNDQQS